MKKQVVNVSAMQAAKVSAALYFVCSFPLLLLVLVPALTGEQQFPLFLLILMPVLYAVLGFVATLIGAWIYNLVAARIGGFEFTTVEVAERS
ncbi:hypothetical protein [Massilia sp. YIM B02443]|uniref:hypothetical protein n=1 Tax=Massilia sp. YIM B02443 TaxID=3050127 RepID=UPI0025B6ED86|nr:hypothetical protein [Massilia sp. YIM B02443]MDN4036244.1 hypothetical protein [Massilia sp. YIM B02443]